VLSFGLAFRTLKSRKYATKRYFLIDNVDCCCLTDRS
jgi:hypothetical protein